MERKATAWERLTRIDVRIWDGLLAAAALVNAQLDLWMARGDTGQGARDPDLLAAAILVVATVPLYERRRRPVATATAVAAAAIAFGALQRPATETLLSLVVAAYSVAAYQERSAGQTLAILALVTASAISWTDGNANWVEMASAAFFTVGLPFAIGRIVWNRRRRIGRERDVAARDAVALERSRIARELHDVVAHSMSVMVVQAGAARAVLRRAPDEAERALSAIEDSGRIGLAEMRRLLSVEGEDAPSLAPQPGLERLDELLARLRATGLEVELVVEGDVRPLAAGVRSVRLPHRPGGAHERVETRRGRRPCARPLALPGRGDRRRGHGRRKRSFTGDGWERSRLDRDARARGVPRR